MVFLFVTVFTTVYVSGPVVALTDAQREFYASNDILYYDDSDTEVSPCGGAAGSCSLLADVRKAMTSGISEANRILIYKTYLSETSANPDTDTGKAKAQAHLEEFLNRAAARFGGTPEGLQKEINLISKYYQAFCSTSASWKNCDARVSAYRNELDQIFEAVLNGSNLILFATDNASAGFDVAESKPRATLICGMGSGDTECKTNDYGIGNTWPANIETGIEYFFNNNGRAWSEKMKEDCAGMSGEPAYSPCMPTSLAMDIEAVRAAFDAFAPSLGPGGTGRYNTECALFSKWFINTYTTLGPFSALGNGEDITAGVGLPKVTNAGGVAAPAVFSVPSGVKAWGSSGGSFGHTGIIIGISGDMATVVHAWDGVEKSSGAGRFSAVTQYSISAGFNSGVTFVNLGEYIRQ